MCSRLMLLGVRVFAQSMLEHMETGSTRAMLEHLEHVHSLFGGANTQLPGPCSNSRNMFGRPVHVVENYILSIMIRASEPELEARPNRAMNVQYKL